MNKLTVEFGPLRHIEMQIFKSALTIPLLLLIRNLIARAHVHTTHQHILKIFVKELLFIFCICLARQSIQAATNLDTFHFKT